MIGGSHRSNTELVAQGTANIFSSLFGGIPATGAIARTATNIKNGGSTPVAGIIHALTLLIILLFAGQWAAMIPMATLAGILAVVAFNMSEWRSFVSLLKGPGGDVLVLLVTFFLTLLADLTIAIEVGMVLACFLFMRNMIRMSAVSSNIIEVAGEDSVHSSAGNTIPADVLVFEITGPLFFGAVYKFKDAIRLISKRPRVMIIRMRNVPIIDATGIKALKDIHKDSVKRGTRIILSGITSSQVKTALEDAGITDDIGKENIVSNFREALERSKTK
jgi:SulP family sulfate permease